MLRASGVDALESLARCICLVPFEVNPPHHILNELVFLDFYMKHLVLNLVDVWTTGFATNFRRK